MSDSKILKILNDQRRCGRFCDVNIKLQCGSSVWGHFAVIAAQSDFVGGEHFLQESLQFSLHNPLKIEICNFECAECLIKIMDFFYYDVVEVSADHEDHFKQLAKILSVPDLLKHFFSDEEILKIAANSNVNFEIENMTHQTPNFFKCRSKSTIPQSKTNTCSGCDFKCYRLQEMLMHLTACESGTKICCLCEIGFYSHKDFQEHLTQHDNPKPFFCFYCDLRFYTKAALQLHIPKHSTETPFKCPHCSKGFKWKQGLNNHLIVHTKEKKLLCDECGFSMSHLKTLRAHKLIHTGEQFRCDYSGCSHTSLRKENLKIHMATHKKETPFVCEICGHKFSQSKNLKRHALIHTESKNNYKCVHCSFTSYRSDKLRDHMMRQHTEKPIQLELPEKVDNSFDSKVEDEIIYTHDSSLNVKQTKTKVNKRVTSMKGKKRHKTMELKGKLKRLLPKPIVVESRKSEIRITT